MTHTHTRPHRRTDAHTDRRTHRHALMEGSRAAPSAAPGAAWPTAARRPLIVFWPVTGVWFCRTFFFRQSHRLWGRFYRRWSLAFSWFPFLLFCIFFSLLFFSFSPFSIALDSLPGRDSSFFGFERVWLGLTGFLLGFTGFYWVLLGFNEFVLGFSGFYWNLLKFTGFY